MFAWVTARLDMDYEIAFKAPSGTDLWWKWPESAHESAWRLAVALRIRADRGFGISKANLRPDFFCSMKVLRAF